MIWIWLRLAIFFVVLAAPHTRTHQGELCFMAALLGFDLVWLLQRRLPEYRTAATLLFSMLAGVTVTAFLHGGSLVSLAFLWPSLMLRLEDLPLARRRAALIACVLAMLALAPASDPLLNLLRIIPVFLSLLQVRPGHLATWANTAALAWLLGPLVEASLFPGVLAPTQVARTALLMTLPQLGLRRLQRES